MNRFVKLFVAFALTGWMRASVYADDPVDVMFEVIEVPVAVVLQIDDELLLDADQLYRRLEKLAEAKKRQRVELRRSAVTLDSKFRIEETEPLKYPTEPTPDGEGTAFQTQMTGCSVEGRLTSSPNDSGQIVCEVSFRWVSEQSRYKIKRMSGFWFPVFKVSELKAKALVPSRGQVVLADWVSRPSDDEKAQRKASFLFVTIK